MEEKRRRFSGFDLGVLVLVLLGAGVWLWMGSSDGEETELSGEPVIYLIEVNNLTQEQIDPVQVGDLIQDAARFQEMGEIINIEVRNAEQQVNDWAARTIHFEEIPERYVMILTVETLVEETEQAILTEGGVIIRGGRVIDFVGPGYAFVGAVILRVERGA